MIRSSKRSLSRDLVRFLQYIDDCVVKRYDFVAKSEINVSFMGSQSKVNGKKPQGFCVVEDRTIEKSRNRMGKNFVTSSEDEDNNAELEDMTDDSEEVSMNSSDKKNIGSSKSRTGVFVKGNVVKPPVRKSIVLDKNRNVYQVYGNTHDLTSSAEAESVDGDEETLVMSRDNGNRSSLKTRNGVSVKGSGGKTTRVLKTVSFDENGNVYEVHGDRNDLTSSAEDDSVDDGEEPLMMSRDNGRRHSPKTRNVVLVKESGGKTRVVKTVSFDENGNVYKVYGDTPESSISEEDDSTSGSNDGSGEEKMNGNEVEEIKYVPKENEGFEVDEEDEETHSENEISSSECSEGDVTVTRNANQPGSNEHKKEVQLQKGSLMFSPPLPLKMEP